MEAPVGPGVVEVDGEESWGSWIRWRCRASGRTRLAAEQPAAERREIDAGPQQQSDRGRVGRIRDGVVDIQSIGDLARWVGVSVNAPTTPSDHNRAMAAMIRVRARHSPGSEPAVGCDALHNAAPMMPP